MILVVCTCVALNTPKFKKNKSEVVRIGSIIICHPNKLCKAKFFILCDGIFLLRLHGKFAEGARIGIRELGGSVGMFPRGNFDI